jgi:hypothetical protein
MKSRELRDPDTRLRRGAWAVALMVFLAVLVGAVVAIASLIRPWVASASQSLSPFLESIRRAVGRT